MVFLVLENSFAQKIIIHGIAKAYKGKKISLYVYDDLITYSEIKLSSTTVKENGTFQLQLDSLEHTLYAFLKIERQNATIYLEPNTSYEVSFPSVDSSQFVNPNLDQKRDLEFAIKDTNDLNALIINFNDSYNAFWRENYQYFVKKKSQAKLDSFIVITHRNYSKVQNQYFLTYVDYFFATIEENTFQGQKKLGKEYILSKPVYYDNYEYMGFFNSFFRQHLRIFALTKDGAEVYTQINERASYDGLMGIMAIDKLLHNDTLRELAMLKGLWELYYTPGFDKDNILKIIGFVASKGKISEHQKIANNILILLKKGSPGTKAPDFQLPDKNGKIISLADFKGKFVYLDFWASWCTPCLQEMKLIVDLKKKFGNKISFICISMDKDIEMMKKFLVKNPNYDWTFLHIDDETNIEQYGVKTVPTYFLISPEGNFVESPAKKPSENIEKTFYNLSKAKEKKLGALR